MSQNGLYITIHAVTAQGIVFRQPYSIFAFNDPSFYQPVFLVNPILFCQTNCVRMALVKSATQLNVELIYRVSVENFEFDVMLVTDEE